MATTITAEFDTRRDAEMSVERLVQELGIRRTDVFIAATGAENTAGEAPSGADVESGHPGVEPDGAPVLGGKVSVSVDLEDQAGAEKARDAFSEFGATNLSEK